MQKDLFNERVIIEESFKKDCDIGNKTLYALCEKYPLYDNPSEDALSGQIWLIGRSMRRLRKDDIINGPKKQKKIIIRGKAETDWILFSKV